MKPRECGPCSECCYTVGVYELDKRPFSHCRHVTSLGCGIYKARPASCREFRCIWLAGHLERKDRPDRTGIVFAVAEMEVRQIIVAFVRKPGADKMGRGRELVNLLAQHTPVCVQRYDGTRTIFAAEEFTPILARVRDEFINTLGIIEDGGLRRLKIVDER